MAENNDDETVFLTNFNELVQNACQELCILQKTSENPNPTLSGHTDENVFCSSFIYIAAVSESDSSQRKYTIIPKDGGATRRSEESIPLFTGTGGDESQNITITTSLFDCSLFQVFLSSINVKYNDFYVELNNNLGNGQSTKVNLIDLLSISRLSYSYGNSYPKFYIGNVILSISNILKSLYKIENLTEDQIYSIKTQIGNTPCDKTIVSIQKLFGLIQTYDEPKKRFFFEKYVNVTFLQNQVKITLHEKIKLDKDSPSYTNASDEQTKERLKDIAFLFVLEIIASFLWTSLARLFYPMETLIYIKGATIVSDSIYCNPKQPVCRVNEEGFDASLQLFFLQKAIKLDIVAGTDSEKLQAKIVNKLRNSDIFKFKGVESTEENNCGSSVTKNDQDLTKLLKNMYDSVDVSNETNNINDYVKEWNKTYFPNIKKLYDNIQITSSIYKQIHKGFHTFVSLQGKKKTSLNFLFLHYLNQIINNNHDNNDLMIGRFVPDIVTNQAGEVDVRNIVLYNTLMDVKGYKQYDIANAPRNSAIGSYPDHSFQYFECKQWLKPDDSNKKNEKKLNTVLSNHQNMVKKQYQFWKKLIEFVANREKFSVGNQKNQEFININVIRNFTELQHCKLISQTKDLIRYKTSDPYFTTNLKTQSATKVHDYFITCLPMQIHQFIGRYFLLMTIINPIDISSLFKTVCNSKLDNIKTTVFGSDETTQWDFQKIFDYLKSLFKTAQENNNNGDTNSNTVFSTQDVINMFEGTTDMLQKDGYAELFKGVFQKDSSTNNAFIKKYNSDVKKAAMFTSWTAMRYKQLAKSYIMTNNVASDEKLFNFLIYEGQYKPSDADKSIYDIKTQIYDIIEYFMSQAKFDPLCYDIDSLEEDNNEKLTKKRLIKTLCETDPNTETMFKFSFFQPTDTCGILDYDQKYNQTKEEYEFSCPKDKFEKKFEDTDIFITPSTFLNTARNIADVTAVGFQRLRNFLNTIIGFFQILSTGSPLKIISAITGYAFSSSSEYSETEENQDNQYTDSYIGILSYYCTFSKPLVTKIIEFSEEKEYLVAATNYQNYKYPFLRWNELVQKQFNNNNNNESSFMYGPKLTSQETDVPIRIMDIFGLDPNFELLMTRKISTDFFIEIYGILSLSKMLQYLFTQITNETEFRSKTKTYEFRRTNSKPIKITIFEPRFILDRKKDEQDIFDYDYFTCSLQQTPLIQNSNPAFFDFVMKGFGDISQDTFNSGSSVSYIGDSNSTISSYKYYTDTIRNKNSSDGDTNEENNDYKSLKKYLRYKLNRSYSVEKQFYDVEKNRDFFEMFSEDILKRSGNEKLKEKIEKIDKGNKKKHDKIIDEILYFFFRAFGSSYVQIAHDTVKRNQETDIDIKINPSEVTHQHILNQFKQFIITEKQSYIGTQTAAIGEKDISRLNSLRMCLQAWEVSTDIVDDLFDKDKLGSNVLQKNISGNTDYALNRKSATLDLKTTTIHSAQRRCGLFKK